MLTNDQLQGSWTGYFTYGPMFGPNLENIKYGFEIQLNVQGNEFTGTCTDDDLKEKLDVPANIQGGVNGNNLRFTKQYPFFFAIDQNGNVHKDPNKPSSIVEYAGTYDANTGMVNGEWLIRSKELVGRDWVEKIFSGNWAMKKN